MVFSFFKKQPEKMITRPAAVPRPSGGSENARSDGKDLESKLAEKAQQPAPPPQAPAKEESAQPAPLSDFSDLAFSDSSLNFQLETDVDPVDAQAEEAAVLFANSQDAAAQAVLEGAVKIHFAGPGERLWLMLFDLYRLSGQQAAFETMGIEYARAFEKSPPAWGGKPAGIAAKAAVAAPGSVLFKGELLGANAQAFGAVRQALEKNPRLRLDMSKVKQCDSDGCGHLLKALADARRNKREIDLLGRDALATLLKSGLETGRAQDKECWLLLLELRQQQGQQEAFEETAIDYAVTFEESPPSWEAARIAAPEPAPSMALAAGEAEGDAYPLSGEVKSSRFGDLQAFVQERDSLVIDCANLKRMDFISAGALLNSLTAVRRAGKQIVFRHPNYLVAELFRVVGLNAVVTVVFPKN